MPSDTPATARKVKWSKLPSSIEEVESLLAELTRLGAAAQKRSKKIERYTFSEESDALDRKAFPEGTIIARIVGSVICTSRSNFVLKPSDQEALLGNKTMANDEIISWAIRQWLDELVGTRVQNELYVFQPSFWPAIHTFPIEHRKEVNITTFFDRKIAILPVCMKDELHWISVAIINPGSVWTPMDDLDTSSYPVIVSADSIAQSRFDYAQFQRVRVWLYDFAKKTFPDKTVCTIPRFARLKVPLQTNTYDCGYHMLHNMRQIHENYQELVHMLKWESSADIMGLRSLPFDDFQRLWMPDVFPYRRIALQKQLKTYKAILKAGLWTKGQ